MAKYTLTILRPDGTLRAREEHEERAVAFDRSTRLSFGRYPLEFVQFEPGLWMATDWTNFHTHRIKEEPAVGGAKQSDGN